MIINYFKLAWRNIRKNKTFFAINFSGLYISIVVSLVIAVIIFHETSFDKENATDLAVYRVVASSSSATGITQLAVTPYPLATAMRTEMPDEKLISQIDYHNISVVSIGTKKIREEKVMFVDSVFPRLFPLTVIKGNINKALTQPGFVLLTEQTAKKYFGADDAMGKRIRLANLVDLEVAAVIGDAPRNTHLPYNMIVSYLSFSGSFIGNMPIDQWGVNSDGFVYIGTNKEADIRGIEKSLMAIADRNLNIDNNGSKINYKLQPVADIHTNQLYADTNPSYTINYQYLYILAAIGLFLILAACINYTNLSTALALSKSKEVGVRKTMGANRSQLIKQFFSETLLTTAVVIILAAVTVRFLIPVVNTFLDKSIPANYLSLQTGVFLFLLWVAVSFLSGIYPALILSGFSPVNALKNKLASPKASTIFLRRGLVTFQFVTAQVLIISALVVAKQMNFVNSKSLGFDKEQVVDISIPQSKPEQLEALRNKLSAIPGISSFSLSIGAPVSDNAFGTGFNLREKYATEQMNVEVKAGDKEYLKTYGLQLAAGRWFDENDERKIANSIPDSLRQYVVVINETAVKMLGFSNSEMALGKYITFGLNDMNVPVIGVVKDYHVTSLHAPVEPVIMVQFPYFYFNAGFKLAAASASATLTAIEKAYNSVYPDELFETNFLDEHIAKQYKDDKRNMQIFNLFTILSIIINALGLIGLLSFVIQQKTKEIGIRKVLGATVGNISFILSKDFVILIAIAFVTAVPLAWYLMNNWLQGFSYRTTISWWVFIAAGAAAVLVTAVAIGFQTIKAALANPVKSLRAE